MIQQIQPRTNFPISRILPDLNDGITYYVQAVVRRADNASVIDTVSLPTQGNRLFGAIWRTPADPSGQGLYVTITSTVYTDSGYTTKSTVYQEESDTFFVYDQFNYLQLLATQIAALITIPDVDYKKFEKMLEEKIGKIKMPEVMKAMELSPHFDRVINTLGIPLNRIENRPMPEYTPTDIQPVLTAVSAHSKAIHERIRKLPAPEKTDLSPIMEKMESFKMPELPDVSAFIAQIKEEILKSVKTIMAEEIKKAMTTGLSLSLSQKNNNEEESKIEPYNFPQ